MIEYRKGDIFSSDGKILVHACNAKGVWGSGIAVPFKEKFPLAFEQYHKYCLENPDCAGRAIITTGTVWIGCLITSKGYGAQVDPPELILQQTKTAVKSFLKMVYSGAEIHSPQINSLRFRVPWEQTEKVINDALVEDGRGLKWVVWIYEDQQNIPIPT